ncbi:AraC family transcriptional regulator, partial [Stenotrophomonas maltophilia]
MADQTTAALLAPALADATDGPSVLAARLHQLGKRRTARHRHAR